MAHFIVEWKQPGDADANLHDAESLCDLLRWLADTNYNCTNDSIKLTITRVAETEED